MNSETSPDQADRDSVFVRQASDGAALHFRHWRPIGAPRGWVLWLHGIQSHSGWYLESGRRLAQAGYDVRHPDRRGSGLNAQERGDAPHWERLVNDVLHFLRDIEQARREQRSDAPVTLCGVSWGGKLALVVAERFPELVDRLVLVTPGIFARIGPPPIDRLRLRIARRLNIERRVPIPLNDPALFTSIPEAQELIRNDPLALHDMTLSFLHASRDLDALAQRITSLHQPTCLMLAESDRIIDNSVTRDFMARIAPGGSQVFEFPGARHTLELETCREDYLQDLIRWIDGASARRSGG